MACAVYFHVLEDLPAIMRQWWNSQDKRVASIVDRCVNTLEMEMCSLQGCYIFVVCVSMFFSPLQSVVTCSSLDGVVVSLFSDEIMLTHRQGNCTFVHRETCIIIII